MSTTPIEVVLALARAKGWRQADLAARIGVTDQSITNWKKRGLPADKLADAAQALGCSVDMLLGRSSPAEAPIGLTLEHLQKTLDVRTVVPKRTLEQIMAGDLGEEFEWALEDDALAPDYARGTSLVWATDKQPSVGSVLLLQADDGQLHVRLMAQGKGTRVARAPNPNYASFDLDADRLKILAVAKWRPMP